MRSRYHFNIYFSISVIILVGIFSGCLTTTTSTTTCCGMTTTNSGVTSTTTAAPSPTSLTLTTVTTVAPTSTVTNPPTSTSTFTATSTTLSTSTTRTSTTRTTTTKTITTVTTRTSTTRTTTTVTTLTTLTTVAPPTTTSTLTCCSVSECDFLIDDLEDGGLYTNLNTPWDVFQASQSGDGDISIALNNNSDAGVGNRSIQFGYQLGNGGWQNAGILIYIGNGVSTVDLSNFVGIKFYAKGTGTNFFLRQETPLVSDGSYYRRQVVGLSNSWQEFRVNFTDLNNPGWGMTAGNNPTKAQSIAQTSNFTFLIEDNAGSSGQLFIDHVRLIAANGTCPLVKFPASTTTTAYPYTLPDPFFPYNNGVTGYFGDGTFLSTDNTTMLNMYNAYLAEFLGDCGDGRLYIMSNPSPTVSEAIAYGMLLAAYMNDKTTLDGLWNFAKSKLDGNGLMHWHVSCGGINGFNAATDADEDMVIALLIADKVWGSAGAINYYADAITQMQRIRTFMIEPAGWVKNGDTWGGSTSCMNVSYFTPGYYTVWNFFDPNTRWTNAIQKSYQVIHAGYDTYGYVLPPNWSAASGQQQGCGGGTPSNQYGYDAEREPWRIATDRAWTGNADSVTETTRHLSFWNGVVGAGNNFSNILGPYTLAGSPGSDNNACFQGMASTVYLFDSNTARRTAAWNNTVTKTQAHIAAGDYFCGSLGMLGSLFNSGNMPDPRSLP